MTTLKEIKNKNDNPTLSDAQKFVGGYVEVVKVRDGILIIDEEGKLKDKPVNEVATKMYTDYLKNRGYVEEHNPDNIVGDAIYIPNNVPSEWHGQTNHITKQTRAPFGRPFFCAPFGRGSYFCI